MSLNGWFQILLFLAAILAVTVPLGGFMTRVFNRERTWLDPVLGPVERLTYRTTGVDDKHEMRWTEYATAMLLFSVVSMLVLYRDSARAAMAAVEPAGLWRRSAGPGVQYRCFVHDQHELAGLHGRGDDELSDADGRPRLPQLRVGGDRYRARGRIHPRHRPERKRLNRQLLGRSRSMHALGPAASTAWSERWCSYRRVLSRISGPTTR